MSRGSVDEAGQSCQFCWGAFQFHYSETVTEPLWSVSREGRFRADGAGSHPRCGERVTGSREMQEAE